MGNSLNHVPLSYRVEEPTVKAELYSWSSAEFGKEYALIYTSRSNPSHTCISYYRVNCDKVLFTFHDCLCEGNTVRIDMEFVGERDHNRFFVFCYGKGEDSSGRFIERRDKPGFTFLRYQDKFGRRKGQLELYRVNGEVYAVKFSTGFDGDSFLTYFIRILRRPSGFVVHTSGPQLEYDGYIRRPIALCYVEYVSGMPPHDVVKRAHVKQMI